MTAVSPFDGANRIRFKGSLVIADCDCRLNHVSKSAIDNRQCFRLSALVNWRPQLPRNYFVVNANCNSRTVVDSAQLRRPGQYRER
jgi:hypothetical protein